MKKILVLMLTLAMLLTMASFPAFADDPALIKLTADNVISKGMGRYPGKDGNFGDVDAMFDGVMDATKSNMFVNGYYFSSSVSDATHGEFRKFVIDLGAVYDLSTLNIYWGGTGAWGIVSPDSYTIYTAIDEDSDYTEYVTYSDMMTAVHAGTVDSTLESYPNVTVLNKKDPYESYNVTEDMTGTTARYIKIVLNKFHQRVGIRELEVYGSVSTGSTTVTPPAGETSEAPASSEEAPASSADASLPESSEDIASETVSSAPAESKEDKTSSEATADAPASSGGAIIWIIVAVVAVVAVVVVIAVVSKKKKK